MNPRSIPDRMTRRELYRTLARAVALGAVTLVPIGLVARSRARSNAEPSCDHLGLCRRCGTLPRCGLPAALSYKQARIPADQRAGGGDHAG